MVKVLVSDPIADKGIEILEEAGFDIVYNPNPDITVDINSENSAVRCPICGLVRLCIT